MILLRIVTPIGLFLVALGVRLVSWHSVFQSSGVYPNGNDAYYHLRRIRYTIEHFPDVLRFDPLINFPHGAQPIWPPAFDWLIAAALRGLPGLDRPDQMERYAVWIPPLVGALTVVAVYFMALHFFSRPAAVVAGGSLALLPGHAFYSRLGEIDHHFLVALLVTGMLAAAMQLFRIGDEVDDRVAGLAWSAVLGLSMAFCVLIWPGTLLHVGVLQVGMIVRLLATRERAGALEWSKRLALAHGVACLAVYPMSAGQEWIVWGSLSPVVLSDFQPLYFVIGSLCFAAVGLLWRAGVCASTRGARIGSAAVLGSLVLLVCLLAIPGLAQAVNDALSWFSKDEEFQSVVNESAPLLAGPAGLARANAFLSPFFFLVPLASGGLAWRFRHQADRLLLLGWTLALFVATLVQWRFMNSYSIAQSLVLGLVWTSGREALASNLTTRTRRVCAAVLAIGLLAATFQPAVRSYAPHWRNVLRSWRGERTDPIGTLWQARILAEAARFLRDHSPDLEAARYSVLAPWGDGHLLQYVARRAVVQDNFGDDVAPENFGRAEAYFAARSESEALRIVSPLETRYVLVRSTGSGHGHGYAEDSQFAKLYRWRGSLGAPVAGGDQPTAPIEALHRHRLIYQSEPLHRGDAHPYVLLFEIVAGAELVGRAPADAIVSASLAIEPDRGRRFFYTTRTRADAAGRFTLRLPYATGTDAAGVRTGDRYHLSAGEGAAEVAIPEAAVLEGTRIEAPALSPEGR